MRAIHASVKCVWLRRLMLAAAAAVLLLATGGCVHEFPKGGNHVKLNLRITHLTGWTELDWPVTTREGEDIRGVEGWVARYEIRAYPKDCTSKVSYSQEFTSTDLSIGKIETTLELPPGEWDIYAWQDFVRPGEESFYDTEDFAAVSCVRPYVGDTDRRDAFEGKISVSIPCSRECGYGVSADMEMVRPLAKYVFIATDFDRFYSETLTRRNSGKETRWDNLTGEQRSELLEGYGIKARYPLFMPAVYDMFTGRVRASWTGMGYAARIVPLNEKEAVIAMDYVFINHAESGAQVSLYLTTPEGETLSLTGTIDVPTLRGRVTYVRGDFLTTGQSGGLEVDVSFSGDINIKI